jgi:hypothetical protein
MAAGRRVGVPNGTEFHPRSTTVKKDIERVKRLQLHRESLRDLDLGAAVGGAAAQIASRTDISFVYTGCLTLCHTTA